ncbi:hypothetical protein KIN20_015493 [Parelaphostrongylus tenuis]|uniref:Uncharacterized protein n=1 Tax=Parelaphostrongylus tenuis TaxID=148309 RepID=A0AAD5N478_PARTN|nr:hypothetical protein KIN20_015493 [Parelaphostrongylus tenuis]
MGAKQSVENQTTSPQNNTVQSIQSSPSGTLILINVVKFQAAMKKVRIRFEKKWAFTTRCSKEEIYRLFRSPHSSHRDRLAPLKIESEEADITEDIENTEVTWSESQSTFDIGECALSQRSYKRCNRSKADPWRRYGALRKLHEIGGTVRTLPNLDNPRVPQNFYQIEAGSIPPPPPTVPPITTVEEYGTLDELLTAKRKKVKHTWNLKLEIVIVNIRK